jgi:hypothetical protein
MSHNTLEARERNKKRDADIMRLNQLGWTYVETAQALGITKSVVAGIVWRRTNPNYADWQRQQRQRVRKSA